MSTLVARLADRRSRDSARRSALNGPARDVVPWLVSPTRRKLVMVRWRGGQVVRAVSRVRRLHDPSLRVGIAAARVRLPRPALVGGVAVRSRERVGVRLLPLHRDRSLLRRSGQRSREGRGPREGLPVGVRASGSSRTPPPAQGRRRHRCSHYSNHTTRCCCISTWACCRTSIALTTTTSVVMSWWRPATNPTRSVC
jgi:hypothetical protein